MKTGHRMKKAALFASFSVKQKTTMLKLSDLNQHTANKLDNILQIYHIEIFI